MKHYYKKLFVVFLFFSLCTNLIKAQVFPESFEGTFPPVGWVMFDNGVGTVESWTTTATAHTGTQAAYMQYENVTTGIAEDWLVSPLASISATANILSFWERESYTSNWGSVYSVLVSTSSQTNITTFTTVATYSETTINPLVYRNRLINLSAYNGQNIYIAFKMQNDDGDDWLLDNIQLSGGCVTPPAAGVITGTSNTIYGNSNQYTVTPITGNIQWLSGPSATGPWTAIPGATNTPQNIQASMGGTMYLTVVASSTVGGCVSDTSNVPLAVSVFFPGDNTCTSASLSIGPSTTYYKFFGASVQTGEVQPPAGTCTSQQTWCNNTLHNTRWFNFTAPASGHVIIQSPDFDTQLAVWSATACANLLSSSTATFVCANDDDPDYITNGGDQFSSYLHAGCLTPGLVYYLQVDGYAAATAGDSTRIILTDGVTPLDPSFTGLSSNYCLPGASSSPLTAVSNGGFITLNSSTVTIVAFNPVTAGVGTHTVHHTVSGCKTNSVVIVANSPSVSAASSASLLCTGQSATLTANGATTYSWSTSATGTAIAISPSVTTTYSVTGTTGSCSTTTAFTQSVSACTGLNEITSADLGLIVYPNPNAGLFTVNAEQVIDEITVTDLLGKKVYSQKPLSKTVVVDIKTLNQGIYFVSVKHNSQITTVKVIKD